MLAPADPAGTGQTILAPADSDQTILTPAESDRTVLAPSDDLGLTLAPGDAATIASTPLPASRSGPAGTAARHDPRTRQTGSKPPAHATGHGPAATTEGAGDTGPLEPGHAFGPRYHIIRLLGIGGMGAVYHAWDAELGVSVAIKVIRPEIMADPRTGAEVERRFKRELLLARQVTHKNVVRIHDIGEIGGIKYITMSYVDGVDLATRLKAEGQLGVPFVLRMARSVVSGLVAAHTAGVVHRDLKPANIMIGADEEALIMDFGIARSSGAGEGGAAPGAAALPAHLQSAAARSAAMTAAEGIVGTVEYMAPEQARGQAVDQRADVYAFGLILYDLLAGRRRAKQAGSAIAELQSRMEQAPAPVRSIVAEVPEALDRVISRCLEPDPANRYQTTVELEEDLNRLDEHGELIPVKRVVGMKILAGVVSLGLVALVGTWWYARTLVPPPPPDPVSVVIADFQNSTNDAAFDGTLEPMLKRALEGAGFITAYDRDGIRRTLGVRPPERLTEDAARGIAVNQGVGVVLAGAIEPQGSGYRISVNATQAVTGEEIASARARASSKDQVLEVATRLVTRVRRALGDEASSSAQMFAMASLSATSLDVVQHWVAGREAASRNDYDEARRRYTSAVELDPKFGLGYAGLANVSSNRANQAEAEKYITEALRYVDGMTERERYTTRAGFYRLTGDYRQCVKEYGDLLASYPADVAAHNNLAICLANLRDFAGAFDELRKVVAILPNRAMYRVNLASYANFSSDFQTGEEEAKKVEPPDVNALMAVAFGQLGQGRLPEAMETYQQVGAISAYGASLASSGLGDLANLEGRFSDAARILEQGANEDLASERPDWAAAKLAALAHTELWRGRSRAAIAAAEKAVKNDDGLNVRFMAARAFVQAGAVERARPLIAAMASELLAEPRAYAKIAEGEIALKNGDPRLAIEALTEANALLDTWLGHFDLGRAYFEAGQFPQADSEFDRCLKRRGEALQLILGDEPTFAYVPPAYYYQGRVRESLGTAGFADSYRQYLDIRGNSTEDPLVPDIRKRAGD
jgi:tetratricopeptide (TPR) repeat protein